MESPELPECPVCLSTYDGEYTIPRVLACGHTTCESCLKNIPQKYPLTIRCPACTQLVKYPSQQGPSALPKNIDLLRLVQQLQDHNPQKPNNKSQIDKPVLAQDFDFFVPPSWSDEFYTSWKNWVLDRDDVFVEDKERGYGLLKEGNKKVKVRLFMVGNDGGLLSGKVKGCVFKLSYVAKVINLLNGMKEEKRDELGFILRICAKQGRICKGCGLWCDLEDGVLYFVCERLNGNVLDMLGDFENGLSKDGLSSFAMIGMEMYEAVIGLHLEGLIVGSLGVSCFELDGFGHVSLSLSEVLVMGRAVHEGVMELGSGGRSLSVKKLGRLVGEILKKEVFVSPEVLFGILKGEGVEVECGSNRYPIGLGSDVWTLACTVLRMLIGKEFFEELGDHVDSIISKRSEDNNLDCSGLYTGLMEKVSSLLESKTGEELKPMHQMLCRSLSFDPGNRPHAIDMWKCIRDLFIRHQHDTSVPRLGEAIHEENKEHLRVLGELCWLPLKNSTLKKSELAEKNSGENQDQREDVRNDKDIAEALVEGKVKFKEMQGHLDCVTGFAIGGGFLFSSSFDKTVQVWSLQDFSHMHTFKGHEHKVMAVIYVDEELPLCITGDGGGGIFLWSISVPMGKEPLKTWYEQKDWRYSGIHALTTAGNGYLYTGSGDRSVKAWSLQGGTLSCIMDGHKSVVSTLAACDGILYSGSWDGTIRLWSLTDHSPLTVLGNDLPGTATSVLSLTANQNILVAAHENGQIKAWRDDVFKKSTQCHSGAILACVMEGKWLFTGGWDKIVNVQELSGDEFQVDTRPIGSIPGGSVVTALLCWQGKLFVGHGDRTIKVYYHGK